MEKHIRRTQAPLLGLFQPPLALPCIPNPLEIDCNPAEYPEPSARGWLTEGEEKKVFCCFFSGKNRGISPVLADICILSPSPIPLLSYFIQSLSDGKVSPFILSSREASCPRGNLQGFPWTLVMSRVWEIQICSHVSVITYKQNRFSLEDKKIFQKLQVWPDPFERSIGPGACSPATQLCLPSWWPEMTLSHQGCL